MIINRILPDYWSCVIKSEPTSISILYTAFKDIIQQWVPMMKCKYQ